TTNTCAFSLAGCQSGWLTVTQSQVAGLSPPGTLGTQDVLTFTANVTNLAPGVYTAYVDSQAQNPGGALTGNPIGNQTEPRSVIGVKMPLFAPSPLPPSPTGFQFTAQDPNPTAAPQTLTLTAGSTSPVNTVTVTPSTNGGGSWLQYNGTSAATVIGTMAANA